jgi:hypothetical protein
LSATGPENNYLWGLVLVGGVAEGFYGGLRQMAQSASFSNFVVHDVSGGVEQDNVLGALSGHTLSYGQLPWFGEVDNRQVLVDLLPPNRIGVLFDSRTVARPTNTPDSFPEGTDCFSAVFHEAGIRSRRTNVFRGRLGARVNDADFTQVHNTDQMYAGSFHSFEFERF